MFCAACDLPTSEFFGDRNNICGTCDDLGVSSPASFYDEDLDLYDGNEDIMCDLAFEPEEYDFDDGRFEFDEGFHECW